MLQSIIPSQARLKATMKILRLVAQDVHGYLPIDVEFLPDLTFLTGLNGSGKTTALQIIMAMLGPRIVELARLKFRSATLTLLVDEKELTVSAERSESLRLRVSAIDEELVLTPSETQLLLESSESPPDQEWTPVHDKIRRSRVFEYIRKLATPVFLGLDRRHGVSSADGLLLQLDEQEHRRRRIPDAWRRSERNFFGQAWLIEVNQLVRETVFELREKQETLDENLRNDVLLSSFSFVRPATSTTAPQRWALDRFRTQAEKLTDSVKALKLPEEKFQQSIEEFFRQTEALQQKIAQQSHSPDELATIVQWLIGSHEVDRISKHLTLLEEYQRARTRLYESLDRSIALINSFLEQTGKSVSLTHRGELQVTLKRDPGSPRGIYALSSGERQMVVMLAQLALNENLAKSGVFIVDEPELSLHISWQERFVQAVRQANPNVQLILATHSPAIILDLDAHCRNISNQRQ